MSSLQQRRFILTIFFLLGSGTTLALVLYALSKNINLFYTPTQLATQTIISQRPIRVGGMVVKQSVIHKENLAMEFKITDFNHQITIHYEGLLPDLFKEGQGIVALGTLDRTGNFKASQVLAKHDEKYMPPEVNFALKAADKVKESL